MTSHHISRHQPDACSQAISEGKQVFGSAVGDMTDVTECFDQFQASPMPSKAAIHTLEYTVCVLKEALRLHTPVPAVSRHTLADDVIGDVTVPANTKIFLNLKVDKGVQSMIDDLMCVV